MPGADIGLRAEDPTIAMALKEQGYVTGQFGKKHLGDKDDVSADSLLVRVEMDKTKTKMALEENTRAAEARRSLAITGAALSFSTPWITAVAPSRSTFAPIRFISETCMKRCGKIFSRNW